MRAISPETVTGLIFAGGRATRMGGINKALVEFEGRALLSHVVNCLQPQTAGMVLSANRDAEELLRLVPGSHVIPDLSEDRPGPLAALESAAKSALIQTEWVLTAPCDAPLLPKNLVAVFANAQAKAREAGSDPDAFVACAGGYFQSAVACVRTRRLQEAGAFLAKGEHRLRRFYEALGCVPVAFPEERAFTNFNTLEEIKAAESGT